MSHSGQSEGKFGTEPEITVSLIVVSFNTREILRECLDSVLREAGTVSIEILVVDNCSNDGSCEMIEQTYPQVRLIRSETNLGFGAANNKALHLARGRYFVLLNSDAFFQPGALKRAVEHMDEIPNCALAGGRLVGRDGSWQPSARCFHSLLGNAVVLSGLAKKFPKSKFFGGFDRTWADPNVASQVDWVPGAFSVLRPEAVHQVGFFDPAFFLYYEEVDLCLRLKRAGFSIWYWPDIVIVHIGGESSRQLKTLEFSSESAQVVLWRMRSTLLYFRKHHGVKVHLARWLETSLYALTVLRNRWSSSHQRQARARHYRKLIELMSQAWKDTHFGRVSPPRPW